MLEAVPQSHRAPATHSSLVHKVCQLELGARVALAVACRQARRTQCQSHGQALITDTKASARVALLHVTGAAARSRKLKAVPKIHLPSAGERRKGREQQGMEQSRPGPAHRETCRSPQFQVPSLSQPAAASLHPPPCIPTPFTELVVIPRTPCMVCGHRRIQPICSELLSASSCEASSGCAMLRT